MALWVYIEGQGRLIVRLSYLMVSREAPVTIAIISPQNSMLEQLMLDATCERRPHRAT